MKILIVEDEKLTRQSMEQDLKELGYSLIDIASDGIEALESIEMSKPDVIFADVRMPRMDGLRLLQEVKKEGSPPIFVVVSSYDSFEYAKTALEQGAFAYLLKPVGESDLKACLSRVESRLIHDRTKAIQVTETDHKAKKYLQLAKKQMLQHIIQEEITDEKELQTHFKATDILLPYDQFFIMTIGIDEFEQLISYRTSADMQLYKFCIENITLELIEELGVTILPFETEHDLGFLVNIPANPVLEEQLTQALDKIIESIRDYLKFSITIGVGETFEALPYIHKSYTQARKAAMTRITQGGNRVYVYKLLKSEFNTAALVMNFETEQKLQLSMEKREKEAAKAIIHQFYQQANEQSANLLKINFNVAVTLTKLLNRLGLNPESFLGSELKLYRQLNVCTSLEQLLLTVDGILEICFEQIGKNEKSWNNSVMAKAMEFIILHYNEDISLQSVSEHISLSPAYLSKQFKKTYNQNFIEFLIQYRMEKARELLKSSTYSVNEVSFIVGFKDEKHFFRTFKKITGVTPGAYKRGDL
jgi:two-component system response regulator YesN